MPGQPINSDVLPALAALSSLMPAGVVERENRPVTDIERSSVGREVRRSIPAGEQWLLDRTAESFLATGEWPRLTSLKRDAARADVELPQLHTVPATDFLWRPDLDDQVILSIAGFTFSASGAPFVEKFVKVVLLCRDIYLGEGDDPPKLTSEALRTQLGFDDLTIAQVHTMLRFEYYITAGGGSQSPTSWYYLISDAVQRFRSVRTIEDFFSVRSTIVRPAEVRQAALSLSLQPANENIDEPLERGGANLGELLAKEDPQAAPASTSKAVPDPCNVFVIHGRDLATKDAMCAYLKALGLHPLDWDEMVQRVGEATPFTGQVIERGFSIAQAFVVLMTPEDEARLHDDLHDQNEPQHERELMCQPRPNVLFEAGMAFGANPRRTVMVHVGVLRPISDLAGRNVVNLGPTKAPLLALARRLETAGCRPIDYAAADAFDPNRFAGLASLTRHPGPLDGIARGRILATQSRPPQPRLEVALHERGRGSWLLEVANRGQLTLNDVEWELLTPAGNWAVITSVLPSYPIASLEPRQHVRIPVAVSTGGPAYVDLRLMAKTERGDPYETIAHLSVYG